MTFELEGDGVRMWCSSPLYARKLVEKGLRLVNPDQAAHLRGTDEASTPLPFKEALGRRRNSDPRP